MEQFLVLAIGAVALMLVITLALQPWFSWAQATPIFISVLSLFVSALALYFTYFWHPSDLLVYLHFPDPKQLGTNTLNVNYLFSNIGNQTVFIEDVAIDELWIKSDSPWEIGKEVDKRGQIEWMDENYLFNDPDIYLNTVRDMLPIFLSPSPSSETEQQHSPVMRFTTGDHRPLEGVSLELLKPSAIHIEGSEPKAAATTVEAGKMREIAATFETNPIPYAKYNVVVVCPVIRLFDSKGQPVLAVCQGWRASHLDPPFPGFGDTMYSAPPGSPPARLLPVGSKGNCLTQFRTAGGRGPGTVTGTVNAIRLGRPP